ncbi:outer membrane beta-barrel protein [Litchfieldella rifensis]|uniref:Outer membrane beta-barrel protein n=1 Tax=Litchfieldella rifensis TaxID=762643 RepID=A0ABV7LL97_9GAMM
MKRLITTTAILTTLVSTSALAQGYQQDPNTGLYLGAGIGQSTLDNDTLDELSDIGFNTDDSDTGYKLFVGYDFSPNFALEASYLDFGDFTADASVMDGSDTVTANIDASADGFGFALLGRLPIAAGFGIHAKVGLLAWDGEVSGTVRENGTTTFQARGNADGTDPFYGVGAEYVISRVMVRGEYERYDLSDSGEDFTIDLLSASVGYLF